MSASAFDRVTTPLRRFAPLAGFVVPTVVIGYGVVIPGSCIAGWNELSVGFGATVVGACITYCMGLRLAARGRGESDGEA
jgi:ABC-type Fe3+ transport system permease subunit